MKKFETTKLSRLSPGDRFYFNRHKDKINEFIIKETEGFATGFRYLDHKGIGITTCLDRKVIFLRNKQTL